MNLLVRVPWGDLGCHVPLPADYHMHTPLCRHATGEPWEYARQAQEMGLTEIGFTDHSPMRRDNFDEWRMRFDQLGEYVEKVERARREYPNLVIKLALEVDYLPGHEDWIRELASLHRWDYFIGSVHYISDSWAVDNPYALKEWESRKTDDVWKVYFERLTQAVTTGLFEIVGHADLPKKFCFYPSSDVQPLFENFLQAARKAEVAVELNTAGLRKDCKEIYPSRRFLEMAGQHGVPITFGSDAHAVSEVGADLAAAIQLAREVGYTERCQFTQRQRSMVAF